MHKIFLAVASFSLLLFCITSCKEDRADKIEQDLVEIFERKEKAKAVPSYSLSLANRQLISKIRKLDTGNQLTFSLVGDDHVSVDIGRRPHANEDFDDFFQKVVPQFKKLANVDFYLYYSGFSIAHLKQLEGSDNIRRIMVLPPCPVENNPDALSIIERNNWELISNRVNGFGFRLDPFEVYDCR